MNTAEQPNKLAEKKHHGVMVGGVFTPFDQRKTRTQNTLRAIDNQECLPDSHPLKTQHTPGPWTVDASEQVCDVVLDSNRKLVARIANNERSRKSNARLIAAAPDLLEALKMIRDREQANTMAHELANAAIAKAEGRAQ